MLFNYLSTKTEPLFRQNTVIVLSCNLREKNQALICENNVITTNGVKPNNLIKNPDALVARMIIPIRNCVKPIIKERSSGTARFNNKLKEAIPKPVPRMPDRKKAGISHIAAMVAVT